MSSTVLMDSSLFRQAEAAGRLIKNAHGIVQVSVYDAVDFTNKMIEADAPAGE